VVASQLKRREVELMSTFEKISLMIAFFMLILALLDYIDKHKK